MSVIRYKKTTGIPNPKTPVPSSGKGRIGYVIAIVLFILLTIALVQERDQIIFPHDFHVEDVELECTSCHGNINSSTSLKTDGLLPDMDACSDCHDIEDDCELCHTNPDDPDTYPISGFTSGLDFSHATHFPKSQDCSECHASIETDDGTTPRGIWSEIDCNNCHSKSTPADHDPEWITFHGTEFDLPMSTNCEMCHTEKYCDDCHHLSQFEPTTHPSLYLIQHGFEARMDIMECTTCHETEKDCRKCHFQQNIFPLDHSQINWTGNFDFPGIHGDNAQDSPGLCQVCHATESCMKSGCHDGGQ